MCKLPLRKKANYSKFVKYFWNNIVGFIVFGIFPSKEQFLFGSFRVSHFICHKTLDSFHKFMFSRIVIGSLINLKMLV